MLTENEEHFKQNIEQVLSIKLNDSIHAVRQEVSEKLFENSIETSNSNELNEFVNFIEKFTEGKYSLKDGSIINITENEKELIKNLFESLNAKNRSKMIQEIFNSGSVFKQHLEFAQQTRNLQ